MQSITKCINFSFFNARVSCTYCTGPWLSTLTHIASFFTHYAWCLHSLHARQLQGSLENVKKPCIAKQKECYTKGWGRLSCNIIVLSWAPIATFSSDLSHLEFHLLLQESRPQPFVVFFLFCIAISLYWLKIEKISMGYAWDWFKSPFPWVSHGTDLSHQNPWDTHGNVLSQYSWLKLPWYTIPSYFSWDHFKSIHSRVCPCHCTSSEYVPTDYQASGRQWLKMLPWVIVFHALFHGTILSQVIK